MEYQLLLVILTIAVLYMCYRNHLISPFGVVNPYLEEGFCSRDPWQYGATYYDYMYSINKDQPCNDGYCTNTSRFWETTNSEIARQWKHRCEGPWQKIIGQYDNSKWKCPGPELVASNNQAVSQSF